MGSGCKRENGAARSCWAALGSLVLMGVALLTSWSRGGWLGAGRGRERHASSAEQWRRLAAFISRWRAAALVRRSADWGSCRLPSSSA